MADISNRDLATAMRAMAWERAKGELRSMLHPFWPEYDSTGRRMDNGFDLMNEKVEAFIKDFEDNCL